MTALFSPGRRYRAVRVLRLVVSTPGAAVGSALALVLVFDAAFAPLLFGRAASHYDVPNAMAGPSGAHLLGTDELGRDVLARVLVAGRLTLGLSLLAVVLSTAAGLAIGVAVAVLGVRARRVLFQVTSVATAFPAIVLALFVGAAVGRSATAAVIGLSVAGVPVVARTAMTLAASVGGAEFVAAARVVGVPRGRLLRRYVLPHIAEPMLTLTALSVSSNLMGLSALSFLGLGVQAPSYDWGQLLSGGLENVYTSPAYVLGPSAAIVLSGVTFSMLGGSLNALLDPRRRRQLERRRVESPEGPADPSTSDAHGPSASRVGTPCLEIENLWVRARIDGRDIALVRGVDLVVSEGERLGIVGESGSGKSLTLSAAGALLPDLVTSSTSLHAFRGRSLRGASVRSLRQELGTSIGMVFQDPMSSLNPALTIRTQLAQKLHGRRGRSRRAIYHEVLRALADVRLPRPTQLARRRPHELSGGMRQRVMIAMALLGEPAVILADEPTTALDATVQAEIIDLLLGINNERGTALVFVSHDIALVSQVCERVLVMYAGEVIEHGPTQDVISTPRHPYTRMLINAVPDLQEGRAHQLVDIPGSPPDPAALPPGCPFAPRCPSVMDRCIQQAPPMAGTRSHQAACWLNDHRYASTVTEMAALS